MSVTKRLFNILRSSIPRVGDRVKTSTESIDEPVQIARERIDSELAGYYANLEIPYNSDMDSVKKAWKRLLKKYHPDLHSTDPEKVKTAHEITQGINHAYSMIRKKRGGEM